HRVSFYINTVERVFSEAQARLGRRTLYRGAPLRRCRMPGELSAGRVVVEDATEASTLYNRGYFGTPRSGGSLELDLLEAVGLVDEESDLTYYNVREALPTGDRPIGTPNERVVVHFLGDRAVVIDEAQGRALHEAGFFGKMIGRRLQLSLLETAFLLKGGFAE